MYQYLLITQPKFSRQSDAKFTHKIEMKAFIGLLCSAGTLRINKQSLGELWGCDRNDIETVRLVMNQRSFKFPIRYILEQTRDVSVKFFTFY